MPRRQYIIGVVFVLCLLSAVTDISFGQTPQTQNIPPDVDISVAGFQQIPLESNGSDALTEYNGS